MENNSPKKKKNGKDKSFIFTKCQETSPSGWLGWRMGRKGSIERLREGKTSIFTLHSIVPSEYFAV